MLNDIPALRNGGRALHAEATNVDGRDGVTADDLAITGNTGFSAVAVVHRVGTRWTTQLDAVGRRLRGIGDIVALAADDLSGTDRDNGDRIGAPIVSL